MVAAGATWNGNCVAVRLVSERRIVAYRGQGQAAGKDFTEIGRRDGPLRHLYGAIECTSNRKRA